MTEPTDRERVAKALYLAASNGNFTPWEGLQPGSDVRCRWLHAADAAIALGAKPPVYPFQTLMGEVMEVWARNCTIQHVTPQDVIAMEIVVRHVLDRAKKLDLS